MPSDSNSTRPAGRPGRRLFGLLVSWLAMGVALLVVAGLLPGIGIESFWGALVVAVVVAALNAVIPPVVAALRLPLTLVLGFLLVLVADAVILLIAAEVTDGVLTVDNFGWALLAALVVAAVSLVLTVFLGSDDTYSIRVAKRIARRQGIIARTDVPGIIYLEIDGLALPVLRRAMRDGNAPNMARWMADGSLPPGRVGDRSLLADRGQPGRDPARLQRGHPGVPVGREGDRHVDVVLGAAGLRRARAATRDRHRPARRRRLQPREPALRARRRT